ncbi:MAG: hypothetical protein ACRCV9_04155 [Burkholderiaceae bacterium]
MDIACSALICAFFAAAAHAQPTPPPPVDLQPPRIIDSPPVPAQRTPRPTPPKAPDAPAPKATPTPTLEQSITPELKPMPADPTQRVIENTRRLMQERQERAAREQRTGKPEATPGRVVVEGAAPVTPDASVSERITEILNPPEGVTSEALPGGMGRRECITQCVGPACCVNVETVPQQHKQSPLK